MLRFERSFRVGIIALFLFNLLSSATSMTMIEKMIPSHDPEYEALRNQQNALVTLLMSRLNSESGEKGKDQEAALLILQDQEKWDERQRDLLGVVRRRVMNTPELPVPDDNEFFLAAQTLTKLQKERLDRKIESFRKRGLASSWVVACMSLLSLVALFLFHARIKESLVNPAAELVRGLQDWWQGNRQRRMRCPKVGSEIYESSVILNDILDNKQI